MSRIGKKEIEIPKNVKINFSNNVFHVEGPKGKISQSIHPKIVLKIENNIISVVRENDSRESRSLHGLTRTLIHNMITGSVNLFTKTLDINGLGFKGVVKGKILELALGFSHPVEYHIPDGIGIKVAGNKIVVEGINKAMVGEVASEIRRLKLPEPYGGKGIKYEDEVIKRKVGKAAATASAS